MDEARFSESQETRPLLIAADWQSRALLLAELDERGIEVRTEAGIGWATRALLRERFALPLVVMDTLNDVDATPARLQRFLAILEEDGVRPSLILLVSVFGQAEWRAHFGDHATILARPCTINEVASVVQERLRGESP